MTPLTREQTTEAQIAASAHSLNKRNHSIINWERPDELTVVFPVGNNHNEIGRVLRDLTTIGAGIYSGARYDNGKPAVEGCDITEVHMYGGIDILREMAKNGFETGANDILFPDLAKNPKGQSAVERTSKS